MIREDFLQILKCPLTHGSLRNASADLLAEVNSVIAAGNVHNRGGDHVEQPLEAGLVDEANTHLYPVREGIPCLLVDEAIDLEPIVRKENP